MKKCGGALMDAAAVDKLVKVLGMLGSHHAGERASAGLQADRLVRERGLTWHQVIVAAPPIAPADEPEPVGWRQKVQFCWQNRDRLSPKNREFIGAMMGWTKDVSSRQLIWIEDIYGRLHDGGGR